MAARPLYVITDWAHHFETYESARLKKSLSWVAMPTKHDGKSYRRLMSSTNGVRIYGAWTLIVQVASKCPVRGILADFDGPLDCLDLADKTGVPDRDFENAIKIVASERIGWLKIITDEAEIAEWLTQVYEARGAKKRTSNGDARKPPENPGDSGESPQVPVNPDKPPQIPADSGHLRERPQIPADSRTPAEIPAEPRPSRARAGGQDITLQDRTSHTPAASPGVREALEATSAFLIRLFGKNRTRLSQDAEQALAHFAADLPLKPGAAAMLEWFYKLPPDAKDFSLSRRCESADALAKNLFREVEKAEAYAARSEGAGIGTEKNGAPVSEPEGWRERFAEKFPRAAVPAAFHELDERVRAELMTPVAA